ncbi:MAG: patatin-like phospholipase family protein [Candidatus Rokubacteria bacterium]|nr:patatin-like phospholipase family protein [Candidatus Rokubacteria bacterium]
MRAAKLAALCLSGGGIRSATFALGVLQGLARAGLLSRFDYLSTVSGGGFIGSWLTAWSHRHPQGAPGVVAELAAPPTSGLTPELRPIHRLREYSNYLSPRLGLLSADTWTLAATYLRNLFLNWLVLVPLLAAVLALPRLVVALYAVAPAPASVNVGGWALGWPEALLVVGFLLSVLAIACIGYERPSYRDHRPPERRQGLGQGQFLVWCLLPLVVSALLLTLYWRWRGTPELSGRDWGGFALFGVLLHVAAFAVYSWRLHLWDRVSLLVVALTGVLGGLAGGVLADVVLPSLEQTPHLGAALAVPLVLAAVLVAATLFIGFASRMTSDEDREWWSRAGAWIMIAMVGWSVPSAIVIWGPEWIADLKRWVGSLGGVAAAVTVLLGASARTAASERTERSSKLLSLVRARAPVLAAPVLAACIAVFLSMGTDWALVGLDWVRAKLPSWAAPATALPRDATRHSEIVAGADVWLVLALIVGLVVVSVAMSVVVNVNKFSLHAMYRNRLIRAYIGASRVPRRPNRFTGFDREDNVYLRDLQVVRPLHVVNMALNLVAGDKLAWQERKAETFTITKLHAGSYHVGYRPSGDYGGPSGMSLGTAVAISGAAASPNMGYHSSPLVTFLMTLFNARLGWWLGNPGVHGAYTYRNRSPRLAFLAILAEALGLTNDRRRYVYLSDGGHFDNLGLVEMILRRCQIVVVSDAGCDPQCGFDDLGSAIRKIRIDLGVEIEMEAMKMRPRGRGPGACCAVGRIRYSAVDGTSAADDGWLVYVKPALGGGEPADVVAYARRSKEFPQEPTADQWFSESQFESYRRLGLWEIEAILRAGPPADLADFVTRAQQHVQAVP